MSEQRYPIEVTLTADEAKAFDEPWPTNRRGKTVGERIREAQRRIREAQRKARKAKGPAR